MIYNHVMRSRTRWLWVVLVLCLLVGLNSGISFAQSDESRFFPETGHWVSGDFLAKYESVPNPELVFGMPLTGQFRAADIDYDMQYFEKVRFELHLDNTPDLRVVISPLGDYLHDIDSPGTGQTVAVNEATCKRIPADGLPVCNSFLTFFNTNGGIALFGYPISETEWRDGMYVQYFERAIFEWHPEVPPGQRVILGNAGERYFYHVEPPSLRSVAEDYTANVIELQAHAFVDQAVMSPTGRQVVYVVVQDQNLQPVAGISGSVTFRLADDRELPYVMPVTNAYGISIVEAELRDQPFGLTEIEVTVTGIGLEAITRAFFQVWW